MIDGEFSSNVTRSLVYYYLNGFPGEVKIIVNKEVINAGIYESGDVWCEIPFHQENYMITEKEKGIFQVKMNRIVNLIILPNISKDYLKEKDKLKDISMEFIEKYKLKNEEEVGVIFLEKKENLIIHPIIWEKNINTIYYKSEYDLDALASIMIEAYLKKESQKIKVIQPSGLENIVEIKMEEQNILKVIISGKVKNDNKIVTLNVDNNINMQNIRPINESNYSDFYKMYKVFERPPYLEKYSDEEILNEYKFLSTEGYVYGYYEKDNCVGLVTYNKKTLYNHPIYYENPEQVAYLSDLTVLEEYRGRGIGTMLMKFALLDAKKKGFKIAYMRTLKPGQSMSYGIALKLGFKLLKETEIVVKERCDSERDITDKRIFLDISLDNIS